MDVEPLEVTASIPDGLELGSFFDEHKLILLGTVVGICQDGVWNNHPREVGIPEFLHRHRRRLPADLAGSRVERCRQCYQQNA